MTADSPFYDSAITVVKTDKIAAQQLLDQLKAETGKDLEFTILGAASSQAYVDFVQANLSQFKNIKVTSSTQSGLFVQTALLNRTYDMATFGINFSDPEPTLYNNYPSPSPSEWARPKSTMPRKIPTRAAFSPCPLEGWQAAFMTGG